MASKDIVLGPWGGSGGNGWDDGSYTGVRQIELSHKDAIGSFNVVYDLNGKPFDGPKHLSKHSFLTAKMATKTPVVHPLTFKTNKKTFGPYGKEEGIPFNFPIENGLIVGLKGKTGEILDAIGFHLSL